MTLNDFILAVEAKPNFRKWAVAPTLAESIGPIDHYHGRAYIDTPEGHVNVFNVWFMVDTETGEAEWQNIDTMEEEGNASKQKIDALNDYLKTNFFAYFIIRERVDLNNLWAEAEVLEESGADLVRKSVLVYKPAAAAVTHKVIV